MEKQVKTNQAVETNVGVAIPNNGDEYAIVSVMRESQNFKQAMFDNLGDDGFNVFDLERVKIPTGGNTTWQIPDPNEPSGFLETKELKCIILYWKNGRAFWQNKLSDGGEVAPPDCQSDDGKIGFGNPGGLCNECQYAKFGSGRGGSGQACKLTKDLFIILPGDSWPLGFSVPPGSLKNIQAYFRQLLRYGKSFNSVETIITLERVKNSNKQDFSRAVFSKGRDLLPEEIKYIRQFAEGLKPLLSKIQSPVMVDE